MLLRVRYRRRRLRLDYDRRETGAWPLLFAINSSTRSTVLVFVIGRVKLPSSMLTRCFAISISFFVGACPSGFGSSSAAITWPAFRRVDNTRYHLRAECAAR
jgi:hypothetical protein